MKSNIKSKLYMVFAITMLAGALILSGCAGGDIATVTINTGIHKQVSAAKVTLFDRLLAFLRPGMKAYADSPNVYDPDIAILTLTITGSGMNAITKDIPLDTGLISVDVPSGPARVFTVVAYYDYGEVTPRVYGGIATKDLAAGESITIPIEMGSLPPPPDYNYAYITTPPNNLNWYYDGPDPLGLIGFILYRAPQSSGPYIPIALIRKTGLEEGNYTFTDVSGISGDEDDHSFYRVSAINSYGEGQWADFYHC